MLRLVFWILIAVSVLIWLVVVDVEVVVDIAVVLVDGLLVASLIAEVEGMLLGVALLVIVKLAGLFGARCLTSSILFAVCFVCFGGLGFAVVPCRLRASVLAGKVMVTD